MEKIALITGAAKRIGNEIAKNLHKKGWKVVIHYNTSINLAQGFTKEFSNSAAVQYNLEDTDNIKKFYEEAKKPFGPPTLLINNASMFEKDKEFINARDLEKHMHINCFTPILLSQEFVKNGGENIINLTDAFCHKPSSSFFAYNLSKNALLHSTKSMALLFAPNCRVNTISPGLVLEPENLELKKGFYELASKIRTKDITKIDDILKAIDLIVSTPSMTGHNLVLDSGLSL